MAPTEFAASLIAYCYATGGSVTSWGRTAKRNQVVGGHPESHHLNWTAADVVYDGMLPETSWANRLAQRFGLRLVRESDHDHLQAEVK